MAVPPSIAPTDPGDRIPSVDAVRGFALFGVLLVNMYNFGAYAPEWTATVDRVSYALMHALFETKSWRLFSLLFGFGFALQIARLLSRPSGSIWVYFRRLAILFFFGMAHALFYDGDILMEYAMLGLVLTAFIRVRQWILLVLAVVLIAVFPVANQLHTQNPDELEDQSEDSAPLVEQRIDHPYLGSLTDIFSTNAEAIPPQIWTHWYDPESGLAIFAMFLLGLYTGRSGMLQDLVSHLHRMKRICRWGIAIGVASSLLEWSLHRKYGYSAFGTGSAPDGIRFLGDTLFAFGSTALALGYGSGIVLLFQLPGWRRVLEPFQSLGRMALTVYLSGTLMFTLLFYGYGFGQLFLLGPAATTAYAVGFFLIQVIFCTWWLNRFRFGPVEWLWRSLTYLKVQPMRRGLEEGA